MSGLAHTQTNLGPCLKLHVKRLDRKEVPFVHVVNYSPLAPPERVL